MKGTLFDFLKLVADNPELARKLGALAAEYDFEFTTGRLSDADLEAVTGGIDVLSTSEAEDLLRGLEGQLETQDENTQLRNLQLQQAQEQYQSVLTAMSSLIRTANQTNEAIIRNMK